jgi:hypothetical protein
MEQLEGRLTPSVNVGTVHLTDFFGQFVEETHYAQKPDVYVYANGLKDGYYDMQVIVPKGRAAADDVSGTVLGWELTGNIHVTNGNFDGLANLGGSGPYGNQKITQPISVYYNVWTASSGFTVTGFDDTTNPGGEYQVVLARHQNFDGGGNPTADTSFPANDVAKSKNFKVAVSFPTLGTSISTSYTLSPNGATGTDETAPGTVFGPVGSTATDTATVIDEHGNPVTIGSVTFHFFNADTNLEIGSGVTVSLSGSNTVTDPTTEGPLGIGDYYFTASYTDGTTYDSSDSGQEPFTIQGSIHNGLSLDTTIHNAATPFGVISNGSHVPLGTSVYDSAALSGTAGFTVTGKVTYELFKGTPLTGTSLGTFGSPTINFDGTNYSVADSSASGHLGAGSYYWVAHFKSTSIFYVSGDADAEPFIIDQGTVSLSTTILANGTVYTSAGAVANGGTIPNNSNLAYGSSVKDSVTVQGVPYFPPQGTVTFTFYAGVYPGGSGTSAGTNIALATISTPLGTSGATSLPELNLSTGSYYFICNYNGPDGNYSNIPATSAPEPFTVAQAPRTQGYWKTHVTGTGPSSYFVAPDGSHISSVTIAGATYYASEAAALMSLSVGSGTSANAVLQLFDQLVAYRLDILFGAVTSPAAATAAADADNQIAAAAKAANGGTTPMDKKIIVYNNAAVWEFSGSSHKSAYLAPSSTLGQLMVTDANILALFNQSGL